MNVEYVKNLKKPDNDSIAVRKEAKELIEDKVFTRDIIEYAIDNFLESIQAYYDDLDPNKLYYQVEIKNNKFNLCFDIEHLAHMLGLPNYKYLNKAAIINNILKEKSDNFSFNSKNWLNLFKEIFEENKNEIINYDSSTENILQKKLNWDKISEKVFSFLNIGILSEKMDNPTVYYRENIAIGREKSLVLAKDIISNCVTGQIRIELVYQTNTYGYGRTETILTPVSIIFVENPPKKSIIRMNGRDFKFEGKMTITQKLGGNYGKH